jgi:sensor c-di-GMP phosphodiesterase-like protein
MIRNLRQRMLMALISAIVGAICGTVLGYLLGCVLVFKIERARLDQVTEHILANGSLVSGELDRVFHAMHSSPFAACSDEEIYFFRQIVYRTNFLKDAGRMRDGRIACSVTIKSSDLPHDQYASSFSLPGGMKIYKSIAPFQVDDVHMLIAQLGDLYAVIDPRVGRGLDSIRDHFTVTVLDIDQNKTGAVLSTVPTARDLLFTRDGFMRQGKTLYDTHCSVTRANCVTTFETFTEALQANHLQFRVFIFLGGLVGTCFGFACSLIYKRNRSLGQQLRRAIAKDRLSLVYQPIVYLETGRIVEAEALVRWIDEDGFPVSPEIFVGIAEEMGFVGDLTRLVVRHALRDMGQTLRNNPEFRLNINITASDLADPVFLPMLKQSLGDAGVMANSLAIEITESSTANNQVAQETIHQLRQWGHNVQIDDFGTGYSSLSYLQKLSVDTIKIDREFTNTIGTDSITVNILPQILSMAKELGLHVIVEGIETQEQADYFRGSERPILGQGWLFGRPVPALTFLADLSKDEMKQGCVNTPGRAGGLIV